MRNRSESQLSLLVYQGKGEMHKAGEKGCLGSVSVAALLAVLMCLEFSCSHLWNGTVCFTYGPS